jgi:hypothetical protein
MTRELQSLRLGMVLILCCLRCSSGGTSTNGGAEGGACPAIDSANYDTSCTISSDCAAVSNGAICPDQCACPNAAISKSALSAYQAAFPKATTLACPCAAPTVACLAGRCGLGTCTSILTSAYDQACAQASDCVAVPQGEICPGACACNFGAINTSAKVKYDADFPQVGEEECPCTPLQPTCQAGTCTPGMSVPVDAGGG